MRDALSGDAEVETMRSICLIWYRTRVGVPLLPLGVGLEPGAPLEASLLGVTCSTRPPKKCRSSGLRRAAALALSMGVTGPLGVRLKVELTGRRADDGETMCLIGPWGVDVPLTLTGVRGTDAERLRAVRCEAGVEGTAASAKLWQASSSSSNSTSSSRRNEFSAGSGDGALENTPDSRMLLSTSESSFFSIGGLYFAAFPRVGLPMLDTSVSSPAEPFLFGGAAREGTGLRRIRKGVDTIDSGEEGRDSMAPAKEGRYGRCRDGVNDDAELRDDWLPMPP